jgi:hypothetical protein
MVHEASIKSNKAAFIDAVYKIANLLLINPDWLSDIMYHESGLNEKAINSIGAGGLIGFTIGTAEALGTTVGTLRNMTNVDQLEYVYKYFKPYAGKIKSAYDLALVTFFPVGIGKPDEWEFHSNKLSAATVRNANKIFDLNMDGVITMGEYKAYLKKWFDRQGIDPYFNPSNLSGVEILANPIKTFNSISKKKN